MSRRAEDLSSLEEDNWDFFRKHEIQDKKLLDRIRNARLSSDGKVILEKPKQEDEP